MKSRLSRGAREYAEDFFGGPVIRRILDALDAAEASEADLKARHALLRAHIKGKHHLDDKDHLKRVHAALDLRVKKWRKQ